MEDEKMEPISFYWLSDDTLKEEINLFINKNFNLLGDHEGLFLYTLRNFKKKYPFINNNLREIINKEIKNLNNIIE